MLRPSGVQYSQELTHAADYSVPGRNGDVGRGMPQPARLHQPGRDAPGRHREHQGRHHPVHRLAGGGRRAGACSHLSSDGGYEVWRGEDVGGIEQTANRKGYECRFKALSSPGAVILTISCYSGRYIQPTLTSLQDMFAV